MLQPVRRRTWAPSGQTPLQRAWDRHDRLSVISALTLSPIRHDVNLYFQVLQRNVQTEDMIWFLTQMHQHFGRKAILVWDRYSVHRSAAKHFETVHPDWFVFEWLPAYAPELNPTEQVWNHAKYADLANFIPDDTNHLDREVNNSLHDQQNSANLLRSFFKHAKLSI